MKRCDFVTQVVGISAGIDGACGRRKQPDRLLGAGRRPEGVFVVVQAVERLAAVEFFQLGVGLAGDVGFEFPDIGGNEAVKIRAHDIETPPDRPVRQKAG